MALARIITRSQACSRELALDLLARGYAVEIVSPDKIPDNIADLELRVDAGPGDQLTATVEAHGGEHSASLEFLHHLKAPMVDFMRRPPEPREAVHFPEEPVNFDAEPSIEDVELPTAGLELPARPPQIASMAAFELVAAPEAPADFEESARLIEPPDSLPLSSSSPLSSQPPSPLPFDEQPSYFAVQTPTIAPPTVEPAIEPNVIKRHMAPLWRDRSAGWFWRAGLALVSVAALAVALSLGLRQTDKASAQSSANSPANSPANPSAQSSLETTVEAAPEKVAAASLDQSLTNAAKSGKGTASDPAPNIAKHAAMNLLASPSATSSPAAKSESISGNGPKELPVAKSKSVVAASSTPAASAKNQAKHRDDLIARDTVTYLDNHFDPGISKKTVARKSVAKNATPKNKATKTVARRHPTTHPHRDGIVAANTVTYLNDKPAAKPAKPDSGTKRRSDLN